MRNSILRFYTQKNFMIGIKFIVILYRMGVPKTIIKWLCSKSGKLILWLVNERKVSDIHDLTHAWLRHMPKTKDIYVVDSVFSCNAICKIYSSCPAKGSQDIELCHLLMEYDKTIIKSLGGELQVIESQVEPSCNCCTIQIENK